MILDGRIGAELAKHRHCLVVHESGHQKTSRRTYPRERYKPEDYPKYDNYDAINVICLMEESRRLREARSYSNKSVRRILR